MIAPAPFFTYQTMISFLIPTYDYTCYKLVYDIHEQAEQLGIAYEIIVAEDGSRSQVNIIANHKITELTHCRHIVNRTNKGRAATCNQLAREAQYDWIVFIDSDAGVDHPDFVRTYYNSIGKADVIVGGLHHAEHNYDPNVTLRFKYEKEADKCRGSEMRNRNPYDKFSTFNVMIRRSVFLCILFDKDCHEYGYEDALFGVELKRRQISILHIDNPLVHLGLDTNEQFLRKSETALRTLSGIADRMEAHSYVGRAYQMCRRLHLLWVVRLGFFLFGGAIRRNLLSQNPLLLLFSVYKLGYYERVKRGR